MSDLQNNYKHEEGTLASNQFWHNGLTITLCGSARFEKDFKVWNEVLTLKVLPLFNQGTVFISVLQEKS